MNRPIRILLVDDNPIFLGVTVEFLQLQEGLNVVGSMHGAGEALAHASELRPDVILVDMNMPEISGLEAIPRLRAAAPRAKIIALTMIQWDNYRAASMEAGAHEFVYKGSMGSDLLPAIHRVAGTIESE